MNDLSKKFILVIVIGASASIMLIFAGIKPGIFVGLAIIGIGGALIAKNHEDNTSSSYSEGISQEHSRYNKTKQNISSNTKTIETTAIEESTKKEWDEFKDKYSEDDSSTMKDDIARGLMGAASDFIHNEKGMESERRYQERKNNKHRF